MSKAMNDFRLKLGGREYVPIIVGGMGVDISTAELALEAARLGGIGHISDAMVPTVSDRRFNTKFVQEKQKKYKYNIGNTDKSAVKFDLERLAEAQRLFVSRTMESKKGDGAIFMLWKQHVWEELVTSPMQWYLLFLTVVLIRNLCRRNKRNTNTISAIRTNLQ